MSYLALKHLHMSCAGLSLALFLLRGWLLLRPVPADLPRWLRISPHLVDTLLLASAIGLAVSIGQAPFVHAWLTAKVLALCLYIVLGSLAIKRRRRDAFIGALLVFAYIVSVAISKQALPIT